MFDQEDAVVDAHAQQQHQRQHVEQLQRLAEQAQQAQGQCAGNQGGGKYSPGLAAVAQPQHTEHQCDADQQQPAHQLAVVAQQLGEIGGAVYPAHAGQAFGGTLQRGQGIGARQVIDHHHADHLPTDFTHPQVAERLRGRRGQEGFGGERRGGELRSLQRLAHRLGHGRQHAGFHLRGQRSIGLLACR